jgi:vacuolar-type H+-ATPase subunit I/STV1
MAADLAHLLDPSYLGDLAGRDMAEVRSMRAECQEVETALSMLRRLVQGRLDIVGVELTRRQTGEAPTDLTELIARLPEVLADRTHAPGVGRLPQLMAPGELPEELADELDGIVGAGDLAHLASLTDTDVRATADALEAFERKVSDQRRALFERIDALQAEITRRYKSAEATVDRLLQ